MRDDKPIFYDPDSDPTPISVQPDKISQLRERIRRLEELIVAIGRSASYRLTGFYPVERLIEEIEREQAAATCKRSKT